MSRPVPWTYAWGWEGGGGCSVPQGRLGLGGGLQVTNSTQSQTTGFTPSVLICCETLGK